MFVFVLFFLDLFTFQDTVGEKTQDVCFAHSRLILYLLTVCHLILIIQCKLWVVEHRYHNKIHSK